MLSLEPVFEFSRHNCVAICSFLVPVNLIATISTVIFVLKSKKMSVVVSSVTVASIFALTLFLHVSTWFMIGIVTPVTFVLFGLGTTCLLINILATIYRQQLAVAFASIRIASQKLQRK